MEDIGVGGSYRPADPHRLRALRQGHPVSPATRGVRGAMSTAHVPSRFGLPEKTVLSLTLAHRYATRAQIVARLAHREFAEVENRSG